LRWDLCWLLICYMSIKCSNIFPAFEIHMKISQKNFFLQNHNRERDLSEGQCMDLLLCTFSYEIHDGIVQLHENILETSLKLIFCEIWAIWSTMTSYRMFLTIFWHFLSFTSSATGFYASMPDENPFSRFFCLTSLADNVLVRRR
jgi:hypothetical protein